MNINDLGIAICWQLLLRFVLYQMGRENSIVLVGFGGCWSDCKLENSFLRSHFSPDVGFLFYVFWSVGEEVGAEAEEFGGVGVVGTGVKVSV